MAPPACAGAEEGGSPRGQVWGVPTSSLAPHLLPPPRLAEEKGGRVLEEVGRRVVG